MIQVSSRGTSTCALLHFPRATLFQPAPTLLFLVIHKFGENGIFCMLCILTLENNSYCI